jgi:hypothetical protein
MRIHPSAVAFALALASCCPRQELYGKPNRVQLQEKAASASVAVLAVAPWQDYRDSVQPVFKLSPDDAVTAAVPSSLSVEERLLSALGASLKVALPTSVASTVTKTHSETGAEAKTTTDATTTSSSGDVSTLATPTAPSGSASAQTLPGSDASSTLGIDPLLRYWAAAALYEEVQLINRYLKDAATGDDVAYVVRLQVSLMPYMRDEPYDAYSLISFFPGPFGSLGEPPRLAAEDDQLAKAKAKAPKDDPADAAKRIRVLPLLVTDDLEGAVRRRSVEDVRQVAVALSAVVSGAGIGGQLGSTKDALGAIAGRDLNSTFTVARVSENTLRCRFGAIHQAGVHYAMIPQTHSVTVLVLVPRAVAEKETELDRTLHLVAQTRLVDVETGIPLENRSERDVLARVGGVLVDHEVVSREHTPDDGKLRGILAAVTANHPDVFDRELRALPHLEGVHYPESIWLDLVAIRVGGSYSSAEFSVPRRQVEPPPASQSPVLVDDGKQTTQVTVRGGTGIDATRLSAGLTVPSGKVTLVATGIKVLEGGKEISFVFPSLAALGQVEKGAVKGGDPELTLYDHARSTAAPAATWKCRYLSGAADKPGFSLTVRTKLLQADGQNHGKLKVVFSGTSPGAQIVLGIDGADVDAIEPASSVQVKDDGWKVNPDSTLTLTLSNLSDVNPVTIVASDGSNKAKHPPVVIPVVHASQQGARPAGL